MKRLEKFNIINSKFKIQNLKILKFFFLFLWTTTVFSQQKDSIALKYANTITTVNLSKHLHVLASDEYEGRETGENGQRMAAQYISNQFQNFGIPPLESKDYYQNFLLSKQLAQGVDINIGNKKYEFLKDYYYFPGFENQKIEVEKVLFLGYGISDSKYDDYKGNKVKDKVVMILSGEPFTKDTVSLLSGKKAFSEWSTNVMKKIEKAKEKNVRVLLIVVGNIEGNVKQNKHKIEAPNLLLDSKYNEESIPVIYISKSMANEILSSSKITTDSIKGIIKEKLLPKSIKVKTKLLINIDRKLEKVNSQNVLGFIEGTDLKNEIVVVSAHYDHLGKDNDLVFNGADDDGSGTVSIIELAQTFMKAKKDGHGPRRSLVFIAFSGEEKGLLGSKYYTQNPVFPLQNTVVDLNIDMIGRVDERHADSTNYVYVIGSDKLSSGLHAINERMNVTYTKMKLDYTYNDVNEPHRYYYRSDHYNFAKNNIPSIFYFNGTHADYHKETDEVEKINFELMQKRARLVFFTAWEIANRNERLIVDIEK